MTCRLAGAVRHARPRAGATVSVLAALATSLLAATGCGAKERPPRGLADGKPSPAAPRELRDLGDGAVLTEARTIFARDLAPRERACIRSSDAALPPGQMLVERVDVRGTSLTFRLPRQRFLYGCMSSAGPRAGDLSWCGHVLGELRGGRLRDPRLDIGCRDASGTAWGSAWIDPVRSARWIAVREGEHAQIYPTAGRLPVRVTTGSVDLPTATALFRVEQYDRRGVRISRARLSAAVAG